jgi:hypothetical protein
MESERNIVVRRAFLFGIPLLYLILGLLHPEDPRFGDETRFFIGLHIAQLFLIGGLAYSLWLLVDGVDGRAAAIARALILPYAIAYTAFDSIVGIAMGAAVQEANAAPAADQAAVARLIDAISEEDPAGYVLYFGAALLWLGAAVAVAVALRRTAPRPAVVLIVLGALVFAVAHPQPTGPIGMGLLLAGIAWLELRPRSVDARRGALGLTT